MRGAGVGRLRIGHAWAAMGEHTVEFQRRWAARHPDVELHLVRTNSPTGGLAEGACDVAVVRTAGDTRASPTVDSTASSSGSSRVTARWPPTTRSRGAAQLRLADLAGRVLAVDPRTGTTTPDLWPPGSRPAVEEVHDVDDWLAVIAAGPAASVSRPRAL